MDKCVRVAEMQANTEDPHISSENELAEIGLFPAAEHPIVLDGSGSPPLPGRLVEFGPVAGSKSASQVAGTTRISEYEKLRLSVIPPHVVEDEKPLALSRPVSAHVPLLQHSPRLAQHSRSRIGVLDHQSHHEHFHYQPHSLPNCYRDRGRSPGREQPGQLQDGHEAHQDSHRFHRCSRSRSDERRHQKQQKKEKDYGPNRTGSHSPDQHRTASPPLSSSKKVIHDRTLVSIRTRGEIKSPAPFLLESTLLEEEDVPPPSPVPKTRLCLGPIIFGSGRAKGLRPYMEDRHIAIESYAPVSSCGVPIEDNIERCFAAVYDGHNGTLAASHATERLHNILAAEPALRTCTGQGPPAMAAQEEERMTAALVHSFEAIDKEILRRCHAENTRGGATGVVVIRIGETIYAAHCGDSRAVLCRRGEPLRLTEDHKPNLPRERKRVEALGGRVDFARCWRVIVDPGGGRPASGLAVSRSFGDPEFKEPLHLVIATPDVMTERLTPEDEFIVLASDGLWDVLSDKNACDIVTKQLRAMSINSDIDARMAADLASKALVKASLDSGTMDNVTALVGMLKWR